MKKELYILFSLCLFIGLWSCDDEIETKTYKDEYSTLYSYLEDNDNYSSFKKIVDASITYRDTANQTMASVYQSFNFHDGGNRYTLFLPTNSAIDEYFNNLGTSLESILSNPTDCWDLSTHHLLNERIYSKDFPNGELRDTSLNGASHIIRYVTSDEGVSYLLDETASVIVEDLEQSNGVIHVIDKVLTPFSYTSCDWLSANNDYSIFTEALKLTGLYDQLQEIDGKIEPFTLFVEADSILAKHEINSINDLIADLSPENNDYTAFENPLYQFIGFHILKGNNLYQSDMVDGTNNYETYATYPLSISVASGLSEFDEYFAGVGLNFGNMVYDTLISASNDTTIVDYISIYQSASNKPTLSGVLHFTNYMMKVDTRLSPGTKTFQFFEDPAIADARNNWDMNKFYKFEEYELNLFEFGGDLEYIEYFRNENTAEIANNDDYIRFSGDFILTYKTSRIVGGDYNLRFKMNVAKSSGFIDVFVDGEQVGSTINMDAKEQPNTSNPYLTFSIGTIKLEGYQEHTVTLKAVTPGRIYWDFVQFLPL